MGKECGAWVSRRLWGGGNTSPLKTQISARLDCVENLTRQRHDRDQTENLGPSEITTTCIW